MFKISKKGDLYLTIYNLIKEGRNPMDISKILNITKQNIQYYINHLKKKEYIKKLGYGTWEILREYKEVKKRSKNFSLGMKVDKPIINLHALQIRIPVLKGIIDDSDWEIKNKLNNWIPKYKDFDRLGGLTLRNNNNKSISIMAKTRDIKDLDEVYNLSYKIRAYMGFYFNRKGVKLDVFNAQTKNLNVATQDKQAESKIQKGEKFTLDLNKTAEKIFLKDKMKGKAWIDGSPFKFSAESNDLEWKREYLEMPFRMYNTFILLESITEKMAYVAENYKSHVGVVENANKLFKKLNNLLSQKKLSKWQNQ